MTDIIFSSRRSSEVFLDHVKRSIESIQNLDHNILVSNKTRTSDLIQSYLLLKDDHFHEKIFKPIVLKEAIRSELSSPGSGEITLLLSLFLLKDMLPEIIAEKHHKTISDSLWLEANELIKKICSVGKIADKKSFDQIIRQIFDDKTTREIVKYSISLSGSSRKIVVEKTNKVNSAIVVRDGYNFPLHVDKNFLGTGWKRRDVNCVIIDGVILEVSEIHHLLTYASESREPYILFVRGLSPDVKNTIYINNNKKTIDVMPIEIPITETTVNIFSDLSAVCGCDITSSYKGDLISKSVIEKISTVNSIYAHSEGISIQNNNCEKRALIQIREIKEKRDKILEPAGQRLFNERIKCLSSGRTEIRIGQSDLMRDPLIIENIDKFFRSIPSIISTGVVNRVNLSKKINKDSKIENHLMSILKARGIKNISTNSLVTSIKMSMSIATSISSTGCILPCSRP